MHGWAMPGTCKTLCTKWLRLQSRTGESGVQVKVSSVPDTNVAQDNMNCYSYNSFNIQDNYDQYIYTLMFGLVRAELTA